MEAVRRVGAALQVQDGDGCRHLLRASSVQAVGGPDPMRNESLITAAGRTIRMRARETGSPAAAEPGGAEMSIGRWRHPMKKSPALRATLLSMTAKVTAAPPPSPSAS